MSYAAPDLAANPILGLAWERMPEAMRTTVSTAPSIPLIAARAKAAAVRHPDMVRGDQGQVVGVLPDREVCYGPSSGLPELRRLVARFWTLAYDLKGRDGLPEGGLEARHAAIVSGATEGVAIVMRMLAPGGVIGVQRYHWGNYRNIVAHAGGRTEVIDFIREDGAFDIDALATAVDRHAIRTLLVNFPANPTGDLLDDAELQDLVDLARRRDLVLVADEVYNWIRYDDRPRTMLALAPERTIVIGAASKEYLIPGARTGYVLCSDEVFSDRWMPRLIRSTSSSPNVLGQRLTIDMLTPDVADLEAGRRPQILGRVKDELRRRRDAMAAALDATGFRLVTRDGRIPQGGISLMARLPAGLDDDVQVIDTAIEMGRFSAIPGTAFGAPGCIRFGYAGMTLDDIAKLAAALPEVLEAVRVRV